MDVAELKKILTAAKREPVNCAVGVAKDGSAVMLAHKTKAPRALLAELEKENPGMKTPCFGTASVDTDEDAKLVKLTLNKAVSGIGRKLKKSIKGSGFSKVMIMLEDGSMAEAPEIDEDEEGETQGHEPAAAAAPPPPPGPPPVDMGALRGQFANMLRQIPAVSAGNPPLLQTLKTLADAANEALKGNDQKVAPAAVNALAKAITEAPPQIKASGPAEGEFVKMQKSRLLWDAARKRVASEIDSLKKAVRAEFQDDPEETMAIDALDQLDEVMAGYSDDLMDVLDDMLNEKNPETYADLRKDAKELIADYVAFTNSNPLVKKLDGDTPFGMKLTIAATMGATLKALEANLR